jgi:transmembrane sensor
MNETRQFRDGPVPSVQVRAAAATWVARLHDERRRPELDARLRAWLDEGEEHQRAFARLTQTWEQAGKIRMRAQHEIAAARRRGPSRIVLWATAMATTLVLAVTAGIYYWNDNAVTTRIGQQEVRLLQDGTRVALNTDTRIEVNYDEHARRVRLIRGEARFDVAKHPAWPFLVSVDGQEIRALGTSFIVRLDGIERLSVTLVEGRISVAPIAPHDDMLRQNPQILFPGQRLVILRHHAPAVDRPDLTHITAWQQGRVEFDATPLAEAANEMNRYNKSRITVADADIAQLRIGGVFHAGDSDEFVRIVTVALGLRADRNGSSIVLSGPAPPPPASAVP